MTIEWDLIFVCVHSRCALVRVLFDGANECIRYIDIDQSSCPKSFIPALKYIHNIFFYAFWRLSLRRMSQIILNLKWNQKQCSALVEFHIISIINDEMERETTNIL